MKLSFSKEKEEKIKCDVLVAGMLVGEAKNLSLLDKPLDGEISKAVKSWKFKGDHKQMFSISSAGRIAADRLLLVGLGEKKDFNAEKLRRAAGAAAKAAKQMRAKTAATTLHRHGSVYDVAEAMLLALYDFDRYKAKKKDEIVVDRIIFAGAGDARLLAKASAVADAVNFVRDLVNLPSNDKSPDSMARDARRVAGRKMRVKVLGRRELERMGMNCFLAVARGSPREPKLAIIDYNPSAKKTVALVGKGIIFDSGGLDIKPPPYMNNMKSDMAGAATVLGVMKLLPLLRVPLRVIGVMPLCENMVSGTAMRPGDIVSAYNKKTVEIVDTDAEGRLILADALSYVDKQYKPDVIIDLATLTGACIVALGYEASGVWGEKDVVEKLRKAADATGERVWELPLYDEYAERMKGKISDLSNLGKGEGRPAGACTAAAFLKNFVEKAKWAHLDIAGPSWLNEDGDYAPAGATGWGVRLLAKMLEDY